MYLTSDLDWVCHLPKYAALKDTQASLISTGSLLVQNLCIVNLWPWQMTLTLTCHHSKFRALKDTDAR